MGAIEGRKSNGHYDEVLIDDERAQVDTALNSWLVDQGRMFAFYDENVDLDQDENNDVLIVTGAKDVHIVLSLEGVGGDIKAQIYEGTVTSADGTPIPIGNFNRTPGLPAPLTTVFKGPTITDVGTLFVNRRVLGGNTPGQPIASATAPGVHRVLKPETKYLLRQIGVVNDTKMTLTGTFYEAE